MHTASPLSSRSVRTGLPGFLRRSLRPNNNMEEEDDNENDNNDNSDNNANNDDNNKNDDDDNSSDEDKDEDNYNEEEDNNNNSDSIELLEQSPGVLERSKTVVNSIEEENKRERLSSMMKQEDEAEESSKQQQQQQQNSNDTTEASDTSSSAPYRRNNSTGSMKNNDNDGNSNTSGMKQSSSSMTSNYKDRQFESCLESPVISITELRSLCWNGIPRWHRARAWKLLLGYLPSNASRHSLILQRKRSDYAAAVAQHYEIHDDIRTPQEQETLRQVLVDVPRTAPEVGLFRQQRVRLALSRLLYIWACRHPASSYVQGINDLATPFIVAFVREQLYRIGVIHPNHDHDIYDLQDIEENQKNDVYDEEEDDNFNHDCSNIDEDGYCDAVLEGKLLHHLTDEAMQEVEADCYWCLTNLLAGIQDHYTSDQPGVQRMVMRLEELVTRIDNDLSQHLSNMGIAFVQFAFKWMNCLLLREFSLTPCIERLWDTYLADDLPLDVFHVYVCAAFLCQFSYKLRTLSEFEDLFAFLQTMPTKSWSVVEIEILVSQAYVLSTLFQGSDAHLANTKLIR